MTNGSASKYKNGAEADHIEWDTVINNWRCRTNILKNFNSIDNSQPVLHNNIDDLNFNDSLKIKIRYRDAFLNRIKLRFKRKMETNEIKDIQHSFIHERLGHKKVDCNGNTSLNYPINLNCSLLLKF